MKGKIKWFNNPKGFGFISCEDGNDVFFHFSCLADKKTRSQVVSGQFIINEDDRVELDVEKNGKGSIQAVNVRILDAEGRSSKAVSRIYKCNPCKIGLDGDEYIQMDIDRFIGYLQDTIKTNEKYLETMPYSEDVVRTSLTSQINSYEGLLGMIEANSFK